MRDDVVGIVPMAGHGTRLGVLPFSKELYPVGRDAASQQPLVVSRAVLEQLRRAGATRTFLVLRDGKWDIPAHYRDGIDRTGIHLAYVMARLPFGVPFSLDTPRPFTVGSIMAMGFPDILLDPPDALAGVVQRHRETRADVVLGLFPWTAPPFDDLVETDGDGRVVRYYADREPGATALTWALMTWGRRFSDFMHAAGETWLAERRQDCEEFRLSWVLAAAVEAGLLVQSTSFPTGQMLDIGSPMGQSRLEDLTITSLDGWAGS